MEDVMDLILKNVNAYIYGDGVVKTSVLVKNGTIVQIEGDITATPNIMTIEFDEDKLVVPGFIDQHVHGASGYDAMDASYEAIYEIAKTLAKEGVTGFLATTITHHKDKIINALSNIKAYKEKNMLEGAEVLGIHLEGPFLSADYKGAHLPEHIVKPSVELFEEYLQASGDTIKMVTLAPEETGNDFITYLRGKGIIASLGHTSGNYECMKQAIHAGATCMTHIYNAMKGFNHREVGAVGAGLSIDELATELIADGIHVSKEAINIVYRAKPKHKLILVTDAMRAKHMPDGRYELGGQEVVVEHGSARLLNGVLAGSILKLNDAVYNMSQFTNIKLIEAVDMASVAPAMNLGVSKKKGKIKTGYDADFAVIDTKMNVYMTIRAGRVIYNRNNT
jgi:N-acetylglucosamine-6-phosphate deacetylase